MRTQHMEKSNENTHVGRFDAIRVFSLWQDSPAISVYISLREK